MKRKHIHCTFSLIGRYKAEIEERTYFADKEESSNFFWFLHLQSDHKVMGRMGRRVFCFPHQAKAASTEMKVRCWKEKNCERSYQICWVTGHLKKRWKFVSSSILQSAHLLGPCHDRLLRESQDKFLLKSTSHENKITLRGHPSFH